VGNIEFSITSLKEGGDVKSPFPDPKDRGKTVKSKKFQFSLGVINQDVLYFFGQDPPRRSWAQENGFSKCLGGGHRARKKKIKRSNIGGYLYSTHDQAQLLWRGVENGCREGRGKGKFFTWVGNQ